MEYAIQLFLPVIGGLLLGNWLSKTFGFSPIWTVLLGVLGLFAGIGILYKQSLTRQNLPRFTPKPKEKVDARPSQSLQDLEALYKKIHEEPLEDDPDFETKYPNLENELKHDDDHPSQTKP